MKRIPGVVLIFTFILLAYVAAIIIIDPFNYLNTNIIGQDIKNRIPFQLNPRMTKIILYKKHPLPNILLGDSRIQGLDTAVIKTISHESYFNFGYGASTIPEVVDNFWFAVKFQKLKNVYIGLSLSMYNKYNNKNLFDDAERASTPFYYFFNTTNLRVLYFMIIDLFSKEKTIIGVPNMSKELYWAKIINEDSKKFFSLYKYPAEFYSQLKDIQDYCAKNDIKLTFFIPATHIELQGKIKEYSLLNQNQKFLDDVSSLGRTFNFDYDCDFNRNIENFSDPLHTRRALGPIFINIMFKDSSLSNNEIPGYIRSKLKN